MGLPRTDLASAQADRIGQRFLAAARVALEQDPGATAGVVAASSKLGARLRFRDPHHVEASPKSRAQRLPPAVRSCYSLYLINPALIQALRARLQICARVGRRALGDPAAADAAAALLAAEAVFMRGMTQFPASCNLHILLGCFLAGPCRQPLRGRRCIEARRIVCSNFTLVWPCSHLSRKPCPLFRRPRAAWTRR